MSAALGGIDVLFFTGPVGEHVASIRHDACAALAYLGIAIDDERNRRLAAEGSIGADVSIGADAAAVRVHVIRTLEEWAMVGSFEDQTCADFAAAMDTHFWAPLYMMSAVLGSMRSRRSGRIANVASVGGVLGVPHLTPYSASKFAQIGLPRRWPPKLPAPE